MTNKNPSQNPPRPLRQTLMTSLLMTLLILHITLLVSCLPLVSLAFGLPLLINLYLNTLILYVAIAWRLHIKNRPLAPIGTRRYVIPVLLVTVTCVALIVSPHYFNLGNDAVQDKLHVMMSVYVIFNYLAAAIAFSTALAYTLVKPARPGSESKDVL